MRYKTKVTYVIHGEVYEPGAVLPPDIPDADLRYLKARKFTELVDVADGMDYGEGTLEDDGIMGIPGFRGMLPYMLKTSEEIYKIRSKNEVCAYAENIGLDLWDGYKEKGLKELQEAVVNFQEEAEAEGRDDI